MDEANSSDKIRKLQTSLLTGDYKVSVLALKLGVDQVMNICMPDLLMPFCPIGFVPNLHPLTSLWSLCLVQPILLKWVPQQAFQQKKGSMTTMTKSAVSLSAMAVEGVYGAWVEPFYARTIEKRATHTKLRDFYKCLYINLGKPISEQYTRFTKPEFSGFSEELFQGVKNNYKPEVLNSVSEMTNEYMEDVVKLTNLMLPHLQQVLARQRRDYGIDEESFPQQYPVEEQASNIDDTPVHNIGMERQCGKVDYRLQKLGTLPAVSRSIILQRCQQLRDGQNPFFRDYRAEITLPNGKGRMKTAVEFGECYLGRRSDRSMLEYGNFSGVSRQVG
eukprot:Em0008g380a